MSFKKEAKKMNENIDYEAIKMQKIEMFERFLAAKKKAEQAGEVFSQPLKVYSSY
ncbi:hypothetical protein [Atlantibacter sp.]|uniref:hypothetical protein n=1 Tax=Atlantibacter sp. TaxID=1903473 RepID=UPI0028ACD4DA|nr:hypothetical protein [Atlantibacter sp.]